MAKIDEGSLSLFYDYQIKDFNGKILKKSRKRRSHSFVKQFIQYLYFAASSSETISSVVDTSNTSRTLTNWGSSSSWGITFNISTVGAVSTYGIVVGTGSTAVTIDDYKLATQVAQGTSSGQLEHSTMVYGAPATDASGTTFRLTRDFTNNSGGNIILNEVGVIIAGYDGSSTRYFLIIRDILSPTITVNNLTTLTINYNLRTTI